MNSSRSFNSTKHSAAVGSNKMHPSGSIFSRRIRDFVSVSRENVERVRLFVNRSNNLRLGRSVAFIGPGGSKKMIRNFKSSTRTFGRWASVIALPLVFVTSAMAQEARSQVSLQGTGVFIKDSNNN